MAQTIQDYLDYITSEHQNKPNFAAVITACVSVQVQVQTLMDSMISLFDLSTPPVGNQLDIIGEWVGISRNIQEPISGVYFTWDSTAAKGWDYGIWQSIANSTTIVTLPDDIYLILILAKIAANSWDGTTEGAYAVYTLVFPNNTVLITDNQNMSFSIAIVGQPLDSLTLALLEGGYLPLRPEGVEITDYIVPVNTGPLFGWDLDTSYVQGWNTGSWGMEVS